MSAAQQQSAAEAEPAAAAATSPGPSDADNSYSTPIPASQSPLTSDHAAVLPTIDTQLERGDDTSRNPFELPPPAELQRIAARQEAKAKEIRAARAKHRAAVAGDAGDENGLERDDAAKMIQKNYRGYRARRALEGYGLDPSTRWLEILKEAKYHRSTQPMSRSERLVHSPSSDAQIRDRWRRIGAIAHHAGSDDTSASEVEGETDEEARQRRERKRTDKAAREKYAKVMGLEYFLEMVDHKHRYGSNLRRYHVEWKKAETNENFFYWLDYGEGKDLDLEDRPRKRLDTEQVRYLSREERQKYLVHIDDGKLCWAKNGHPITTSPEFRDSINGIVPVDDPTPTWREVTTGEKPEPSPPGSDSDSISGLSTGSAEDEAKYVNPEFHDAKGLSKVSHTSVDTIMNHMLRKTTKKNTWIFVADTSFRLYVGIKQSGAFQHSSFLRGARISAAGLIRIKRGQLRKLSPLSGHYAPPLRNFREFVKTFRQEGADLSHVNLSRSYAVLLGLEGYLGAKRRVKGAEQGVKDLVRPDSKREREQAAMDTSQSAARERQVLEAQEREKRKQGLGRQLMRRLKIGEDSEEEDRGQGGGGGGGQREVKTKPSSSSPWLSRRRQSARSAEGLTMSPTSTSPPNPP